MCPQVLNFPTINHSCSSRNRLRFHLFFFKKCHFLKNGQNGENRVLKTPQISCPYVTRRFGPHFWGPLILGDPSWGRKKRKSGEKKRCEISTVAPGGLRGVSWASRGGSWDSLGTPWASQRVPWESLRVPWRTNFAPREFLGRPLGLLFGRLGSGRY